MRVHLHTLTYNEEKILPFFFQHYEKFVTQFFIHDNYSSDNTEKICRQRSDVVFKRWNSDGKMDSFQLTKKRNSVWKDSVGDCDFVIVCDADEFLYAQNIKRYLSGMKKNGYTVAKPTGFGMVAPTFPTFDENLEITDQIKKGHRTPMMDKCVLFSPSQIDEMNFGLGSHNCLPEGRVKVFRSDYLQLLHYKALGVDYSLERKNLFKKRVPKKIMKMGVSKHYFAEDTHFVEAIKKAIKKGKVVI